MKKNFLGLSAIVLALAFSAYTPSGAFATFEYSGNFSQCSIQSLNSWTNLSLLLCYYNGTTRACQIEVSDKYYHDDDEELVLNNLDFHYDVLFNPQNHPNDLNDWEMCISAALGDHANIYLVNSSFTNT